MNNYQQKRILEAQEHDWHLSEWDNEFIANLAEKDEDYELSEKQNKQLNRIAGEIARI